MTADEPSSIQTRPSLLNRLKSGDDTESWQEFYRIYGKLARDFAIHAGLTDTEADEVVQETAIGMARHLPAYHYDPKVCRFKTWLLTQTSWRIKDLIKRREHHARHIVAQAPDETGKTSAINRVADPDPVELGGLFEQEWRKNLFDAALERVRGKVSARQFQIFDLVVNKGWLPADVAKLLGVTLVSLYVTRHRVGAAIKKEVKRLEAQLEQEARRRALGTNAVQTDPKAGGE
jgi:RNA polymerase sigma factor (sigma-70 family)